MDGSSHKDERDFATGIVEALLSQLHALRQVRVAMKARLMGVGTRRGTRLDAMHAGALGGDRRRQMLSPYRVSWRAL